MNRMQEGEQMLQDFMAFHGFDMTDALSLQVLHRDMPRTAQGPFIITETGARYLRKGPSGSGFVVRAERALEFLRMLEMARVPASLMEVFSYNRADYLEPARTGGQVR